MRMRWYLGRMLDFETCNAARLRRDPVFDGLFFTAVRSTMIYCRPVCPVKQPLTKNVSFYSSAAMAEKAGYRPCLRCRPEAAPFSPAWNGTKTTVDRALRLIAEGALDRGSVDALAQSLGIGARHLSRLVVRATGVSPLQHAKTLRLQRAKRLLDDTTLSITEVAFQAGFSSIRQFNDAFSALYNRPPSALRRPSVRALARKSGNRPSPAENSPAEKTTKTPLENSP
ncbi:MAG: bifunctional transcriptional activator/DNA repair enzyme AdaA [Cypionkella sp.]